MPFGSSTVRPASLDAASQYRSPAWLALCRPGFEAECGQELLAHAQALGRAVYLRARPASGVVEAVASDGQPLTPAPALRELIFARQCAGLLARCEGLAAGDRVAPLLAALPPDAGPWRELLVEAPDSEDGRALAPLARALAGPLRQALDRADRLDPAAGLRLHAWTLAGDRVWLAQAALADSSGQAGGIPRLRRLAGAPSRSAAKLDEALAVMLTPGERERLLRPGMSAVDLGAAPGGWTWVLARAHLRVTAIDNGPLAPQVLDTGVVDHVRADGFRWRPARPVDWLVCDMVEQPGRVADLIGRWLADGACRHALFNLKLPMKKRHAETLACLARLRESAGIALEVRCRQLYHDREEVTVVALRA
ncbi:MAG: 23S rRNA (cytidine(2498)-2'-O)-methyltransferase RlmM [Xanthomonadales bacterium]|nr:23S rRNA (cytidine(2498)-2'-O)-methyltransferase RlmM [Xanthomonadales bacterium]